MMILHVVFTVDEFSIFNAFYANYALYKCHLINVFMNEWINAQ